MEETGRILVVAACLVMSFISFCLMGVDKHRARKKTWRIPEKTLFLVAILGGAVGGTIGMFAFHHKTRHWYFRLGFPVLALGQIVGLVWLCTH